MGILGRNTRNLGETPGIFGEKKSEFGKNVGNFMEKKILGILEKIMGYFVEKSEEFCVKKKI